MEESIYKMILDSIPFMSNALLWGIFIGFLVYLFMKLYYRFEKIEITTGELRVWVHEADHRFTEIDQRFVEIDKRFIAVETRLQNLEIRVEIIENKLDRMEEKFDKKFDALIQLITTNQETTIRLFHTAIESAQRSIVPISPTGQK